MQLLGRKQVVEAHGAAQREGEDGERAEGPEEAAHEVKRAVQVAHPLVVERHDEVEAEQRVAERERHRHDGRIPHDAALLFRVWVDGAAGRQLLDVGREIAAHEAPRQPGEQDQDEAVAKEEHLGGEPRAQVRSRRPLQPAEQVKPAEKQSHEQRQRHEQERHRSFREADHEARPVPLGELLGGGEHDQRLRYDDEEHEVEVICLPGTVGPATGERPQKCRAADDRRDRAERHERPHRRLPRLGRELAPGDVRSGAHRPPPRWSAWSVRT